MAGPDTTEYTNQAVTAKVVAGVKENGMFFNSPQPYKGGASVYTEVPTLLVQKFEGGPVESKTPVDAWNTRHGK